MTTSSFQLEWSSFLIEFQVCAGLSQTMTFMERAVNQVLVDVDWHGRQMPGGGWRLASSAMLLHEFHVTRFHD